MSDKPYSSEVMILRNLLSELNEYDVVTLRNNSALCKYPLLLEQVLERAISDVDRIEHNEFLEMFLRNNKEELSITEMYLHKIKVNNNASKI